MSELYFEVMMEPKGKARPRVVHNAGRVHSFTPEATKKAEDIIRFEAVRAMEKSGLKPWAKNEPLIANVFCCFTIPKSATKRNNLAMLSGLIRPTKKPDCDNVAKLVLDALNGVAYFDDSQIVSLSVTKKYSTNPRIQVSIFDATAQESA